MFIIKDTVDPDLKNILLEETLKQWDHENGVFRMGVDGGKRGYLNIQNYFSDDVLQKCNIQIDNFMQQLDVKKEDYGYCRHFIGVNTPGAWVTTHTDMIQFPQINDALKIINCLEIRFNFFLQYPESGGKPVLRTEIKEVPYGYGWYFNASIPHSSTPVEGKTNRIVISFGSLLRKNVCKEMDLI